MDTVLVYNNNSNSRMRVLMIPSTYQSVAACNNWNWCGLYMILFIRLLFEMQLLLVWHGISNNLIRLIITYWSIEHIQWSITSTLSLLFLCGIKHKLSLWDIRTYIGSIIIVCQYDNHNHHSLSFCTSFRLFCCTSS
jgi:hypothetical protein